MKAAEHGLRQVGSYRILDKIGEGGMGLVYTAQREGSNHTVALKLLRDVSDRAALVSRFRREADVLRRLRHPGIAAFYDAGLAADEVQGIPYIAMELVEGVTLLQHAEQAGLDDRLRIELFARLCDAVHHAHEVGVLHRDLKPSNVLVVPDPEDPIGHPKVLDFGIAKALDAKPSAETRTRTGALLGTVPYMSPEQVNGHGQQLDARSDLYTLGVILFELLTGRLPYDVMGRPFLRAAQVICFEEPDRLGLVAPQLAGELELVLAQTLEKDPAARYPDVAALARDLRAHLAGDPVTARAPGPVRRARKWFAFHPVAGSTLAVATLALLGMTVLWTLAVNARAAAQTSTRTARTNEALTAGRTAQVAREKQNVLRLSDLKALERLSRTADDLWPVHPDLVPRLDDWLSQADALVLGLGTHEAFLGELEDPASSVNGSLDPEQQAWWLQTLAALVEDLRAFADPELGTLAEVRRRRAAAATIHQRSLVDHADSWARACADISSAGVYDGLELTPQLGLVPLDVDPVSGLWEFWHVESGLEPVRDGDSGILTMTAESGIVLVLVPGGVFLMGAANDPLALELERPAHEVELAPFFLSKFELTQGQWLRCAGENPAQLKAPTVVGEVVFDLTHPIEKVSWEAAHALLRRYGLDLPTEAQWEYAARAGIETPWFVGEQPDDLSYVANLSDRTALEQQTDHAWQHYEAWSDGWRLHAPVGTFEPNPFGLYDTHGNVFEWVRDAFNYQFYAASPRNDPFNDDPGIEGQGQPHRIIRGGSFMTSAANARSSARLFYDQQGVFNSSIGVRAGKSID